MSSCFLVAGVPQGNGEMGCSYAGNSGVGWVRRDDGADVVDAAWMDPTTAE